MPLFRRKDKRKPPPEPVRQKQAPLLDRNAASAAAVAAAAQQTSAQQVRRLNTARRADKENVKRSDDSHRRWGKRTPATDRKKRRPRHQPTVLNKSVTTDRRRSIKVASPAVSPSAHQNQQPPVAKKTSAKQQPQPPQHSQQLHQKHQNTHRRKPSNDRLVSNSQPTWPHIDLIRLLRADDVSAADIPVRRLAAAASRDDATRLKMINEGAAAALVNLLHNEHATLDMRRNATFAIAELAVLEACEDELVASGTVPILICLIDHSKNRDRSMLGNACRGLRNLLGGKQSTAVQAAKFGCVEHLLAIIDGRTGREEQPEVVVEATAALSNLSLHGLQFQRYVIKHGGIAALTSLGMRTDHEEALFHVVNVLAEFARVTPCLKHIVNAGGLNTAFRALQTARDAEVVAEAARLIGNVAVTQKARLAVIEAGGLLALIDRLMRCKTFNAIVPAFDIVRAISNVCVDTNAAGDALTQRDSASVLLHVFTAEDAPEKLVKAAFYALHVLAYNSPTRRSKVLYAIGTHVKSAGLAGLPVTRLYDLRQSIVECSVAGDKNASAAMPESLERLSRASVRLINSGVLNHSRGNVVYTKAGVAAGAHLMQGRAPAHAVQRVTDAACSNGDRQNGHSRPGLKASNLARKSSRPTEKFRSTGRVLSVTQPCKRKAPSGIKQLAEARVEDDEYTDLPRGNEEDMESDAVMRARMLEKEADGNMTQDFFEIGQILGKGGYGSVFMAKDVRSGELVAIKRFHNSGALVDKKAIKEQNIWRGLHHPNVVEFKGSFVGDNGSLNLVVEYVDGLSLAEHLSQYNAFPETLVAEIARQVLCGLKYLHDNGVTHRDLKPANILVDSAATVKICDFGVSRSENVQTINPGQQHMVGTPWYIAPEMVEYRPYTTSVDVWSLGCTVLELATGRRPYHELSAMQVLFRMVEDRRPPIPSHLSEEAQDFLKSCWVWDPQERPSAHDLLRHPFILKARKFSGSSKPATTTPSTSEDIFEM